MILNEIKISIFDNSSQDLRSLLNLITVNYRTYNRLRVFSTFVLGLSFFVCNAQNVEYRTIDGTGNHPQNLGAKDALIVRIGENAYVDGISQPAAPNRTNPRSISTYIFQQNERVDNRLNLSDYVWAFGQFLDHDISLVHDNPVEYAPISVVEDDDFFQTGDIIAMNRSQGATGTGTDISNPREYTNAITSFIDASNVYGSDEARAEWLRDPESSIGKLKVSSGNFLPWNTTSGEIGEPTSDPSIPEMDNLDFDGQIQKSYVAGDTRANENPLLLSLHTLFVREHNRMCDVLHAENPGWTSDKIYLEARKWIGAYLQSITFYEWLPSQGVYLPTYNGYRPNLDPRVSNVFSAAAFRMGHTLINSDLIRMQDDGAQMTTGNVALRDAYFNPTLLNLSGGIEPFLRGMATNLQQDFDCKVIDDLRNFLFADTANGAVGGDLAAININRGRERGLPDYNTVRYNLGLPRVNDFIGITGDAYSAEELATIYNGDYDDIDPWVGMLAEEHEDEAILGKTVMTILERQFELLRDADRFYFENDPSFTAEEIEKIKQTTLQDIIMRNADISLMQKEVFEAMPYEEIPNGPQLLPLQLEASLYPNPTADELHVKYYMEIAQPVTITMYSSNGELLSSNEYSSVLGDNFLMLNLGNDYPRGLYNIKLETADSFKILRVVKR